MHNTDQHVDYTHVKYQHGGDEVIWGGWEGGTSEKKEVDQEHDFLPHHPKATKVTRIFLIKRTEVISCKFISDTNSVKKMVFTYLWLKNKALIYHSDNHILSLSFFLSLSLSLSLSLGSLEGLKEEGESSRKR